MKNLLPVLVIACAIPTSAMAADDKRHPPEKAMDSATPRMTNPEGTEGMHPPQKAMDNAVPTEKMPKDASASTAGSASTGASDGSSGASFPDWDIRTAGETVDLNASKK